MTITKKNVLSPIKIDEIVSHARQLFCRQNIDNQMLISR